MFFIVFGELVFLAFESKGLQSIDERYPCVLLSFGSQTWLGSWNMCALTIGFSSRAIYWCRLRGVFCVF